MLAFQGVVAYFSYIFSYTKTLPCEYINGKVQKQIYISLILIGHVVIPWGVCKATNSDSLSQWFLTFFV